MYSYSQIFETLEIFKIFERPHYTLEDYIDTINTFAKLHAELLSAQESQKEFQPELDRLYGFLDNNLAEILESVRIQHIRHNIDNLCKHECLSNYWKELVINKNMFHWVLDFTCPISFKLQAHRDNYTLVRGHYYLGRAIQAVNEKNTAMATTYYQLSAFDYCLLDMQHLNINDIPQTFIKLLSSYKNDASQLDPLKQFLNENLSEIFEHAHIRSDLDTLCKDECLSTYWAELVAEKNNKTLNNSLNFAWPICLKLQADRDNYTLIRGHYYFRRAIQEAINEENTEIATTYYQLSASDHCFLAMHYFNKRELRRLRELSKSNRIVSNDELKQICSNAKQIADHHLSPGYIVLAKTLMSIAIAHENIKEPYEIKGMLELSLQYLYTAKQLESSSSSAFYNAYQGGKFHEYNQNMGENIGQMLEKLKQFFITHKYLTPQEVTMCEHTPTNLEKAQKNTSTECTHNVPYSPSIS